MSAILQINRDFPFQVSLTFDEAAMDVLDWLEGATFEWDMYVDLPENAIKYCFRRMAEAIAFKRRCGGKASCRQRPLTVAGLIRSRSLRAIVSTVANS